MIGIRPQNFISARNRRLTNTTRDKEIRKQRGPEQNCVRTAPSISNAGAVTDRCEIWDRHLRKRRASTPLSFTVFFIFLPYFDCLREGFSNSVRSAMLITPCWVRQAVEWLVLVKDFANKNRRRTCVAFSLDSRNYSFFSHNIVSSEKEFTGFDNVRRKAALVVRSWITRHRQFH